MTPNLKASASKGRGRVPIIKVVMGADWGFSLEDCLLTYKVLITPVIGFEAPIFLPPRSLLNSAVAPLQLVRHYEQSQAATQQRQSNTCTMSVRCSW